MAGFVRLYNRLIDGLAYLSAGLIVLITALVCTDVTLRNTVQTTLPWQVEISEYAQYMVTFLGAPWVLRLGGHVRVDMILSLAGPARAVIFEIIADLLGLFAALVLFGYGLYTVYLTWRDNQLQMKMLVVPEWLIFLVIVFSGLLLTTEFIRRLSRARDRGRERDSATVQL